MMKSAEGREMRRLLTEQTALVAKSTSLKIDETRASVEPQFEALLTQMEEQGRDVGAAVEAYKALWLAIKRASE